MSRQGSAAGRRSTSGAWGGAASAAPSGPRKGRTAAPLTPDQTARLAKWQARQEELARSHARARERRRLHPRREAWLDALVGLAGVTAFFVFWLSYFGIIRW